VDAHKDKVREMVVERHKKGGRSLEESTAYYDEVDASNFDIVSNTKYKADKVIAAYYELSEVPTSQ
jgi:pantothenate kinase